MDARDEGNARLDRYVAYLNNNPTEEVGSRVLAWQGEKFLGEHLGGIPEETRVFLSFFNIGREKQKDLFARAIGTFLNAVGADAYAYVDKAFMSKIPKEKFFGMKSLLDDPDKKPIVFIHYECGDVQLMRVLSHENGMFVPDTAFEGQVPKVGRFARLLTKFINAPMV